MLRLNINRASRSAERMAFAHFLRTGRRVYLTGTGQTDALSEQKYNHNHDPRNGQFTFAMGGARSAGAFIRSGGGAVFRTHGEARQVKPRLLVSGTTSARPPMRPPAPIGHNGGPPLKDNVPLRALFPGLAALEPGIVIASAAVLSNPIGPAASLIASLNRSETERLIRDIKGIDPAYRFESLGEPLTVQGWTNQFNQLRWTRATAAYRINGDHSFLQAETVRFVQARVDAQYKEAVLKYDRGEIPHRLSREEAIGTYVDRNVRRDLRYQFGKQGVSTSKGSTVRINGREYDTSGTDATYRIPDARVGHVAIDMTLTRKTLATPQVRGFFNSDFLPEAAIIVRPSQLGANSSYIITRPGT